MKCELRHLTASACLFIAFGLPAAWAGPSASASVDDLQVLFTDLTGEGRSPLYTLPIPAETGVNAWHYEGDFRRDVRDHKTSGWLLPMAVGFDVPAMSAQASSSATHLFASVAANDLSPIEWGGGHAFSIADFRLQPHTEMTILAHYTLTTSIDALCSGTLCQRAGAGVTLTTGNGNPAQNFSDYLTSDAWYDGIGSWSKSGAIEMTFRNDTDATLDFVPQLSASAGVPMMLLVPEPSSIALLGLGLGALGLVVRRRRQAQQPRFARRPSPRSLGALLAAALAGLVPVTSAWAEAAASARLTELHISAVDLTSAGRTSLYTFADPFSVADTSIAGGGFDQYLSTGWLAPVSTHWAQYGFVGDAEVTSGSIGSSIAMTPAGWWSNGFAQAYSGGDGFRLAPHSEVTLTAAFDLTASLDAACTSFCEKVLSSVSLTSSSNAAMTSQDSADLFRDAGIDGLGHWSESGELTGVLRNDSDDWVSYSWLFMARTEVPPPPPSPVPEPATWALMGMGLLGLGWFRRQRRTHAG